MTPELRSALDELRKEIADAFLRGDMQTFSIACQSAEALLRKHGIWKGTFQKARPHTSAMLSRAAKERWAQWRARKAKEQGK